MQPNRHSNRTAAFPIAACSSWTQGVGCRPPPGSGALLTGFKHPLSLADDRSAQPRPAPAPPARPSRCRLPLAPSCPASTPCWDTGEVGVCSKTVPPRTGACHDASSSGVSLGRVSALAGHTLHLFVGALPVGVLLLPRCNEQCERCDSLEAAAAAAADTALPRFRCLCTLTFPPSAY